MPSLKKKKRIQQLFQKIVTVQTDSNPNTDSVPLKVTSLESSSCLSSSSFHL